MRNISSKNIEDIIALSPLQEGMLFHYLKEPGSDRYFEQLCLEISGKIDVRAFEKAWNTVIEINEALRAVFRWEKIEKPTQIILKKNKLKLIFYDLSNEDSKQKQTVLEEIKNKNRREGFDLRQVSIRIILCKIEETKYEMVISNHHILYDGWSNGIILKEFFKTYNDVCSVGVSVKPVKTKFREFIKWIQTQDREKQEQYWREYLDGFGAPSELPIKKRRKTNERGEVENCSIKITTETQEKLEVFVNTNRITLSTVFNSVWGILLQRYCNTKDVLFGVTVSGRNVGIKGIEEMVGLFINTIPLRVKTFGEEKLIELVFGIESESHTREEFEHTPLSEIRKYSDLPGVETLFETLVAVENYPLDNRLNPLGSPLKIESYSIIEKTHYDLAVGIMLAEEITVNFYYNSGIFEREAVEKLAGHFDRIVRNIMDHSEEKVSQLEIISEEEKGRILNDFNDQGGVYPGDKTIHELFRGQAEKTPDHIAIVGVAACFPDGYPSSLTYFELNEKSNFLAHELKEKGIESGDIVGIQVERSIEMIVGILGILKTGAAYMPINPKNPKERTDFMLQDTGTRIIVGDRHACPAQPLNFSTSQLLIPASSVAKNLVPAYIIYTSGSTGNPKGVLITHANISPLLHWGYKHLGLTSDDRSVQNLSYYFDWSVWEIFISLTSGASLYMVSNEIIIDSEMYIDFINRNRITVLHITPTHFQTLIHRERKLDTLRHLCIGAEKLTVDLVKRSYEIVDETCRVYNMYGPTEATIMAAVLEIERSNLPYYKELSSIPIGKTLGNNVLLVLDRNLRLSPLNIPGELYIGGEGVASGYLNNPELTSQKFIMPSATRNSFEKEVLDLPKLLLKGLTLNTNTNTFYKTGDLAKWLSDGTVEYLGRIDQQVKIRGYRVEPGEIENRLLEHGAIKDVIVVCRQYKTGENYLSAYVVYHPERSTCPVNMLKDYLSERLPDYMVPTYIVKLERMPLNPNGKVDIKALPEPGIIAVGEYIAARNEIEKALVNIWGKVLEIDTGQIGIDDDFFEMGGHSLNVTSLIGRIHKELKIEIPFTEIFVSPTIRELASYIEQKSESYYGEIPQTEEKEYYPLSSSQKRMYLLHQMETDSVVYNIHGVMRIEGDVDTEKFENVFLKLIERHESLRTSFEIIQEEPIQRINKQIEFKIENIDLKFFMRPFNLSKAPLLRVGLIKQDEKRYLLVIEMSHIISDGASMGVLIKEFISLYKGEELPGLRIQYKDYSQWNIERSKSEALKRQKVFWLDRMAGEIPVLNLPTDSARPVVQRFEGAHYRFEIEGEEARALKTAALEQKSTMYGVLTVIYAILLSKLSGQEEIIIGTPVIGRKSNYEDISNIIGMFVNTLALRLYPSGDKRISELVKEVSVTISEANENQEYPFEDLVENIVKRRDAGRNPLFDVMIATQDLDMSEIQIPGLELKPYENDDHIAKFDMVYICEVREDRILFTVEYSTKLFKKETIKRIVGYFQKIVNDVLRDKEKCIGEIEIITEEEKSRILYDFNDTQADYPKDKLIHELFRGQAEKTPNQIAVVDKFIQITYRELDKKSNALAYALQEKGIEPGDIVGIKVERSLEMIVGILGILKTGAAYLPINSKNPQERTDFMLQDSNAKILLTACSVCPDKISKSSLPTRGRVPFFQESTVAYVIYTSGSTGNPKGVSITHSNFSPLIHWGYRRLGIGTKDRALQNLAYYFDWSVWEIFITLTTGASLYMVSEDVLLHPEKCVEFILKNTLTVLHITPTQYHYIVGATQKPVTLRYLFIGAEKLTYELTKRSIESVDEQCRVFNMYGPTEATIISAVLEIDRKDLERYSTLSSAPIGTPTGNTTLLIFDKNMKLCPVKIVGELYIGGAGVANGYLNNPELSSQKFIMHSATRNPFEKGILDLPKLFVNTFYRTGDLARWLSDGNVEFLGRIDHQVKIRGYRIELGEIENALIKHEAVREAVVKVKGENLYAYIVAGTEQSTHEIKEYLSGKLPDYMVPSVIVKLDKMPLSPTGKIDLKSLPEPGLGESYEAPRNEVEEKLVEVWSETLGIEKEKIGIGANFFEMGGHSLTATLLISKIHKAFNVNIPLVEIFITPFIRGLGEYIQRETKDQYISIEPVEDREYYDLSSGQRRIYLLQRMEEGGTTYNIPAAWILEGVLDKNRLEDTFAKLIKRHESFRTTFEMKEEEPVQRIHDEVEFEIENLTTGDKRDLRSFNLSKAPLMRVGIIRIEEEKHIMMIEIHHIISDGMSVQVLAHDFAVLYAGEDQPELLLQYKDYAGWQRGAKGSKNLLRQSDYWRKEFDGEIPVLELPTDYARPAIQSFEGDRINFEISKDITDALKALTIETGATLYMALLALYNIFLSKVSGHEDIIIGTPVAGRRHADLEKIMGMFVNTLVLRNKPSGGKKIIDFLNEVKEKTLKGLENQDYQYEELVEQLSIGRDIGRNPLFDTMFTLQSAGKQTVKIPGLKLEPYEFENKTSKFDLTLIGEETEEKLLFTFEYCGRLFKQETIERFIDYFKNIVKAIIENKDWEISEIEIITEEEKSRILYDFNDTQADYPKDKLIHELFRGQAEKTPNQIAVVDKFIQITYRELDKKSNALAYALQEKGIEPGDIVGIKVERSLEMIVGILGILKTGAAYLPINSKNPQERTDFMLKDSRAKLLITTDNLKEFPNFHLLPATGNRQPVTSLAYIIYTSGSTGNPKGVSITHSNFSPLIHWGYRHLGIGTKDRVLQNLAYYFDWSVWEIFITLTTGASLYMVSEDVLLNPEKCVELILKNTLTVLHITPTQYHYIVGATQKPVTLRYLFIGAEKLTYELTKRSIESVDERCRVFNMYGPTEATIISAVLEIDRKDYEGYSALSSVPIGTPTGNTTLLIFDKNMKLCPVKIVGELYIGGAGVANGYLNNPELTSQKFIMPSATRNPFEKGVLDLPKLFVNTFYRTGDLARWLSDGNVEFLGRIDHQVKIRGYRIELGEIENALIKHEAVREAVVKVKGENLYAYIVAGMEQSTHEIKEYLSGKLPDYMVPSVIVKLDKMPLSPTGKIDLKSLPEPGLGESFEAPRNEVEEKLVEVWSETLGIEKEKIGIGANFFEMGGHSLTATLLISKIHKAFNVNIPLVEIFITPFIRGLGEYIQRETKDQYISIEPVEDREYYDLSSGQRRIYLLQRMEEGGTTYNIPAAWILEGVLDKNRLEDTFTKLIKRHESLRTTFEMIDEEPIQRIHNDVAFEIDYFNLATEGGRPFNLTKAPLMRVGIIRIEEEKHIMMIEIHHIISDGMSVQALANDFAGLYPGQKLAENRLQYKDYSEWQKGAKGSESLLSQGIYWREEFEGEIPVLNLPTDYARPAIQSFEGDRINFEISRETANSLKALTKETGTTLYIALIGIYTILLSKVSGSEDIVIGTPVAGRRHADLEKIMGMFVNTLALRNTPSGEKPFIDFLNGVKEKTLKALDNQDYQYEELVEQLSVNRDISRNPLFDTMFAFQNTGTKEIEIPGMKLTPYDYENKTSKFDLTLIGKEADEKILFTLEYCVKLFKQETIERFIDYFKNIIKEVIENKNRKIFEIEIITEEEKRRIQYDFNESAVEYPKGKTLHELFRGQANKTPDHIAVVGPSLAGNEIQLSYRELNEKSDSLVYSLQEKGTEPDVIVGIKVKRSVEMVIGILGILNAGAAYLPIGLEYPQERIDFILKDSNAKILLNDEFLMNSVVGNRHVCPSQPLNFSTSQFLISFSPVSSVSYVIYTSGTTGKPKGVLVESRNAVNTVSWFVDAHKVGIGTRVLQVSDYTFDASVNQVFGPLISGAGVYIVTKEIRLDIERLRDYIIKHRINIINFVPTLLKELLCGRDRLKSLHTVLSGAEKLDETTKEAILEKGYRLVNQYGPTETTIDALALECASEKVTLGKPISNVKVYIVDKYERVSPIGVVGELYIAGDGVSRGYLNRPEMTSERFISIDIDNSKPKTQNSKLYRTGDLVRWLSDGNVELIGRIDQQVKVRGYRIELGEIENRLLMYEPVKESVVICKSDERGDNYLIAYIVSGQEIPGSEIREYLLKQLPDYMIPMYFTQIEKIPLTANGKIDREALPALEIKTGEGYVAPRNMIEGKLVEIWAEALGVEKNKIGINDNFFQLGGHSLKAILLVSKIHKQFHVNVPLTEIFKTPTIIGLSNYIKGSTGEQYVSIEPVEEKEYYSLSSAQKRLYVLNRMDEGSVGYNLPSIMILEGEIDRDRFENVFRRLIQRHESLRTSFELKEEEPVQRIHKEVEFKIENFEKVADFIRAFDLSKAPLFRVGLKRKETDRHIFIVDMSHIISDGLSSQVLIRDFTLLYSGKELGEIKLQYKDYADWQNREKEGEKYLKQGAYWKKEFEGEIPALELPTDYARPAVQSFEGSSITFDLGKEEAKALKALTIETGTTMYMALLALYNVLLFKITGSEDIVIGTPTAGRRHVDLEKIMGMFVNTLALRNYPAGEKEFKNLLAEVKETTLKAFENQDYQYEEIVDQLSIRRDVSRNPLFDSMFVLQNIDQTALEIPGLKLIPNEYENKTSKFDLTLIGVETEDNLSLIFEYSTKLFREITIERFVGYYKKVVKVVIENKDLRISEIEIITEEEKSRILNDFNDTEREYPKDKTIHEMFEEQASRTPDHIAIVTKSCQITYRELDEKSNNLAHEFVEKGVGPDSIVGIMIERSEELLIGVFGILKAGAAYLPIDPDSPQERIDYMLKDSGANLIVGDRHACPSQPLNFSTSQLLISVAGGFPPTLSLSANTCYIIYTSGTTGKPKGVLIENRNLANYVNWFMKQAGLTTDDRALLTSSFAFDLGYTSIYPSILGGARLSLIPKETYYSSERLLEYIIKNRITYIKVTPSLFSAIVESPMFTEDVFRTLRLVVLGGEAIKLKDVEKARIIGTQVQIMNHYGPTESAIGCVAQIIDFNEYTQYKERPTIGRPIDNVNVLILDKGLKLIPVGVPGELYITGAGVGRGYLNNPEMTAERFISFVHRFHRLNRNENSKPKTQNPKLYRTGDLARWLNNGNIEFLGRIDSQVKIRGYRVETGEINNCLLSHKNIKEAAVIDCEAPGSDKYLCAYIVWDKREERSEPAAIMEYLAEKLPDYMIPSNIVEIEKIPLTANGKLNRKLLPTLEMNMERRYTAPRNKTEVKLAQIWTDVIGRDRFNESPVGIDDNFFHIGGHSLNAIIIISRIHKEFQIEIPLSEIFKKPTIRGIAEYIGKSEYSEYISIEPVEAKDRYSLSSAQKRLYILYQMDENGTSYNMPYVAALEGEIEIKKLRGVFYKLIKRHESLRTSFGMFDGEPYQQIHDKVEFEIENFNLGDCFPGEDCIPGKNIEEKIHHFIRPFDLSKAPLFRVGLIKKAKEKHILMVDMSHIISDGISRRILIEEFIALYGNRELPALRLQCKDYAEWQSSENYVVTLSKQEAYWKIQFEDEIPLLDLPIDYVRPSVQQFEGSNITFEIEEEKSKALKTLAKEEGTTLYMILLAIYYIFLSKITNQEDIVVGTPTAGRRHADLEQIIGMFVNTLSLRNNPSGEKTYKAFLEELKERTLEAFENQDYQYEKLVEVILSHRRDASRNPLFDAMFSFHSADIKGIDISGIKLVPYDYEHKTSKFDLTLTVVEAENEITFNIEYSIKLFKEATIERFIGHIKNIVKGVVENKNRKIFDFEIMTEEEKNRILYDFNDTEIEYPKDKTIHSLFEEQVERTPDNIALVYLSDQITYRELNEKSNVAARMLLEKGVEPDTIVAIKVERSIEMIVEILGILKSGGAYLPIDPNYPQDRIDYMLKDSGATLLVAKSDLEELPNLPLLPVTINRKPATSLAYVIYTSGTTGKPKGAAIEHRNVVRLLFNDSFQFEFSYRDTWTMFHSYCFDFSVWEMYGALLYGGKLLVIPKMATRESGEFLEILKRDRVTVLNQTPSAFYNLANMEVSSPGRELCVRYVIFGGEALAPSRLKGWKSKYPKTKLINMYGITETTVHVTYKEIEDVDIESTISNIGKPIPTLSAYIVDKNLNLQPIGVSGELIVGGEGVGRGYINRPELTTEKFVQDKSFWIHLFTKRGLNPHAPSVLGIHFPNRKSKKIVFSTHISEVLIKRWAAGGILYRSGDLARWLNDGNLEYLGRIDHQVKIRGYRIELGEIETRLVNHKDIKEAVVLSKVEKSGDRYLCAYIVSNREIPVSELREYLVKVLPDYMIPSYFVRLEKIPLTSNGKVEKAALPDPGMMDLENYVGPRNEIEAKLVKIWSEVLGRDERDSTPIGIDDNFFEIGGHSLKAAIMTAKIHKEIDVKIHLAEVFTNPTVRSMAEIIAGVEKSKFESIEPVEEKEYYPLSSAQKRLYILHRMDERSVSYNIPSIMILEGGITPDRFENAFRQMIQRHESLRTTFELVDEEPVQRIHEKVEFKIDYLATGDCIPGKDTEEKIHHFIHPFNLSEAPLMRVGLIRVEEEKHIMIVDMSHIITDGSSVNILVKDFMYLYREMELTECRIQYKDFSEWQNRNKNISSIKKQEIFWENEFAEEIPVLALPTDYPRAVVQSFEGHRVNFEINKETIDALKVLTLETGTTFYMALLAIYSVFLSKISGQEDIVIGSPVAGRRHADLEQIIGMFVNTLALRNYPSGEKIFTDFLHEVKERTLKVLENQDYQYEELVEQLSINRDISRNPLFDTMFSLQNIGLQEMEIPGLKMIPYNHENKTSKFDLTLIVVEESDTLLFTFEYSVKLFKSETVERFIDFFKRIIEGVLENRNWRISDFEIIAEEEKRRILYDFNNTGRNYPNDKTIHRLFEEQVERVPDNIALVYLSDQITYRELNEKSNGLAFSLQEKGVEADTIVAIKIERSIEMIIGILGILKSGGAYLPIDPEYPQERIDYMVRDSGAQIIIGDRHLCPSQSLNVSTSQLLISVSSVRKIFLPASSLAYVIYTSGTTGRPKGVLVENRSVIRLVKNTNYIHFGDDDRLLQTGAITFDASTFEIWGTLLNGSRVCLAKKEDILDPVWIKAAIRMYKITIMWMTSGLFNRMTQEDEEIFYGLRVLLVGGDVVSAENVNKVREKLKGLTVIDGYGPTENTTFSTTLIIDREIKGNIPIGKPIANSTAYIVDRSGRLAPVGVVGELLVGGAGIARGYMNNPEMTAERFIMPSATKNPFEKRFLDLPKLLLNHIFSLTLNTNTLYKTGDFARWLDDGNIEFSGRIDTQVKIRGYRIEPGEIETRLINHKDIKEVVVLSKAEKSGDRYLCAYFLSSREIPVSELREYLVKVLPDYMIPSYFVRIEKMPLTPNGKIDRKALPAPEIESGEDYVAPRDILEEKLVETWAEVLRIGKEKIGVYDNFFQLGGHSLKATMLVSKIHKSVGVKITIQELFQHSTINDLASFIRSGIKIEYEEIENQEEKIYYEMSYTQKRLWYINRINPQNPAFNMPMKSTFNEIVDEAVIRKALEYLMNRHESLRTSFREVKEGPVQVIESYECAKFKLNFETLDLSQLEIAEREKRRSRLLMEEAFHLFNIEKGPLFRARLVKCAEEEYDIILNIHHIVSDGWSLDVLKREFIRVYEAYKKDIECDLEVLKIQYKDYASWQNRLLNNEEKIDKAKEFWKSYLGGSIPVLNLPYDFSIESSTKQDSSAYRFVIPGDIADRLHITAEKQKASFFMILLAGFNILLSQVTGQKDIILAIPAAARQHEALHNIVGMFVNTLILRNNIIPEEFFVDFFKRLQENTFNVLEFQDFPLELICSELKMKYPTISVFFNMPNIGNARLEILNNLDSFHRGRVQNSKFDVVCYVNEYKNGIEVDCHYVKGRFSPGTIEEMMTLYTKLLGKISEDPLQKVGDYGLGAKKKKLIRLS